MPLTSPREATEGSAGAGVQVGRKRRRGRTGRDHGTGGRSLEHVRGCLIGIVTVCVLGLVIVFGTPLLFRTHGHPEFPVQVRGRLVDADTGRPLSGARVITAPNSMWAGTYDPTDGDSSTIQGWRVGKQHYAVRLLDHGGHLAQADGEGDFRVRAEADGSFAFPLTLIWTVHRRGWWRLSPDRPPPRGGVGVLRVDLVGSKPVILDLPMGAWTEHEGFRETGGPWATYDVGVVRIQR